MSLVDISKIPLNGVLRKMMSKEEIREANKLVKAGALVKGVSDDKQRSVVYFPAKRWQEILGEPN